MKRESANQRHTRILELLSNEGEVLVLDLSGRFHVTAMTIRRDLELLEQRNLLVRTHGGAILSGRSVAEFAFQERSRARLEEKCAIAREVATLISPGMTVVLDTGTTTLEVARAIEGIPQLKVLTSSLAIASLLQARENIELVLLGGHVRANSPDLSGPLTEENLLQFRAELAVLGADAADKRGAYASDIGVSRVSKAMIACADRAALVVDSRKFSRTSFAKFANWRHFHHVFTDNGISKSDLRWLKSCVNDVRCAGTAGAPARTPR